MVDVFCCLAAWSVGWFDIDDDDPVRYTVESVSHLTSDKNTVLDRSRV